MRQTTMYVPGSTPSQLACTSSQHTHRRKKHGENSLFVWGRVCVCMWVSVGTRTCACCMAFVLRGGFNQCTCPSLVLAYVRVHLAAKVGKHVCVRVGENPHAQRVESQIQSRTFETWGHLPTHLCPPPPPPPHPTPPHTTTHTHHTHKPSHTSHRCLPRCPSICRRPPTPWPSLRRVSWYPRA